MVEQTVFKSGVQVVIEVTRISYPVWPIKILLLIPTLQLIHQLTRQKIVLHTLVLLIHIRRGAQKNDKNAEEKKAVHVINLRELFGGPILILSDFLFSDVKLLNA
jgi:hypothetical protein